MEKSIHYFSNIDNFKKHIFNNKNGAISIKHQNLENYKGVVFYIGIHFNFQKKEYQLNLEWICFGLDLFGDNLVESYVYQYKNIENLLNYIYKKHQIKITDIPTNYRFNDSLFPNPIKNIDQKNAFEMEWKKFENDFKKGIFLDTSQKLVYISN